MKIARKKCEQKAAKFNDVADQNVSTVKHDN